MVKLICTDVDGTLLNRQRAVDEFTIKTVEQLHKQVPIVLASSRMPKALWHIQKCLGMENVPIICYNGALVLSSGITFSVEKVISSITLPAKSVSTLIRLAALHDLHISIFQNNTWLASAMDFYAEREINNTKVQIDGLLKDLSEQELNNFIENGAHKVMIMGKPELLDIVENGLKNETGMAVWRSKDIYLEITPHTNKGDALQLLLETWPAFAQISLKSVMSFGDGYNDFELIKNAGYGIAVANAVTVLKGVAYAVTKSNLENGVAYYIDKFFANQSN